MTYSRLSREGVHSRVHSPAHHVDGSCPHRWARRVFQNSESDEARHGVPAHARPRVRIPARGAIGAHTHADSCLRSRCAGDAPLIVTAATAGIVGVVATVSAGRAPLPVASTSPLRPCAHGCLRVRLPGPRQRTQGACLPDQRLFFRWGLQWVSVGGRRAGQEHICAQLCSFACRPRCHPGAPWQPDEEV